MNPDLSFHYRKRRLQSITHRLGAGITAPSLCAIVNAVYGNGTINYGLLD
jgi:hypothetical protein